MLIPRASDRPMDRMEFEHSLGNQQPPSGLPPLLQALWWAARGDWEQAHTLAQDVNSPEGAWVHAYLHRREGDQGNAAYWYRQANRTDSREPFDTERQALIEALLAGEKPEPGAK